MRMDSTHAVMGKITSVYGVKGWVKVFSYTQPKINITAYKEWILDFDGRHKTVRVSQCKPHKNGFVAQVEGVNDRDAAESICNALIKVPIDELPELEDGEYYWYQLQGLIVKLADGSVLGKVHHLIETGSNDVLVVRSCAGSLDGKERLIPYMPGEVVKYVNLAEGEVEVDWDPDF